MKFKKLGIKISVVVTLIIIGLVISIISIVSQGTYTLITNTIAERSVIAHSSLKWTIQNYQDEALSSAEMIAQSPEIIDAILSLDIDKLETSLKNFSRNVDLITLCDVNGIVLARSHSDKKGDDVTNQKAISTALSTGKGISTIEKGTVIGLSTRGSAAIKDYEGNIIGALTCGHDLSKEIYVDRAREQSGCEVTLFSKDERMNTTLTEEDGTRSIGTKASDSVIKTVLENHQDYTGRTTLFNHQYDVYYSPLIIDNEAIGMLFTGIIIDDVLLHEKQLVNQIIFFSVIALIISIVLLIIITKFWISIPLNKISLFASQIKEGDIGVHKNNDSKIDVKSYDEVGQLARSLEDTCTSLKGYVNEIDICMNNLSNGDLTRESTYPFKGDFIIIKDSINNILKNLNRTMTNISTSADQVAIGSEQIAQAAQSLAQSSTEQAASVEELSSSISIVSNITTDSLKMVHTATSLEDSITVSAEKGSAQMENMIQSVKEINEASTAISKVMKSIDDIAFQTNILALNAAVEAARAGQHGKGFAVVAEEVRNLATKSSQAAKETADLITNSIEKAELGMRIAGETSDSLTEILDGIKQSGQIIRNIASSSEEQTNLIESINLSIDQVSQVVQQNSATAEESAASSSQMHEQTRVLNEMTSQFKLKEQQFNKLSTSRTEKKSNINNNTILSLSEKY